jgi:hypothetical protein
MARTEITRGKVDDFTRECLCLVADTSLSGASGGMRADTADRSAWCASTVAC